MALPILFSANSLGNNKIEGDKKLSTMTEAKILQEVKKIRELLEKHLDKTETNSVVSMRFHLPDHLWKTMEALLDLGGSATATMVSEQTGRERAVESGYLNQLEINPQINISTKRIGRTKWFTVKTGE